jgi:hypothetical protein
MTVSFAQSIVPLFRSADVACMKKYGVGLDDYAYMSDPAGDGTYPDHANARDVYDHLTGVTPPRMPMGGPYWSSEQLKLFEQWMADGFLA